MTTAMTKYPAPNPSKAKWVRKAEPRDVEVAPLAPRSKALVCFRYSYFEASSQGGRTRVKAKQARLEDGKLSSEAFDAELDATVYDDLARQVQQHVPGAMAGLLRLMRSPWS